jgi:dTDP-4-dehydrorhamnose 3,5-epimerase
VNVVATALPGVVLIEPKVFGDARGLFFESFNEARFAPVLGPDIRFVQYNQSRSSRGVLRGLHYQVEPEPQAKLVRCVAGEIFDVAVDLRRDSVTFGQWTGARLSGTNHQQLWVPAGFAHGFLTLSESAEVLYKTAGFWNRTCERSLLWNDPAIGITWPTEALEGQEALLSAKDAEAPTLAQAIDAGDVFGRGS